MMNSERMVQEVMLRAGIAARGEAEQTIEATLGALGALLSPLEAARLVPHIPAAFRSALERCAGQTPWANPEELYRRVAREGAVEPGEAVERTQIVCRVLGELGGQALRDHVPERLAGVCHPAVAEAALERPRRHRDPHPDARQGRTLASGRPASNRSVVAQRGVEVTASGGVTHSRSVAAAQEPRPPSRPRATPPAKRDGMRPRGGPAGRTPLPRGPQE